MILTEDQEVLMSLCEGQLFVFDPGERLERRTSRAAAIGTMAVGRVEKLIRHCVCNGAAEASSSEYPSVHLPTLYAKLSNAYQLKTLELRIERSLPSPLTKILTCDAVRASRVISASPYRRRVGRMRNGLTAVPSRGSATLLRHFRRNA
jgi:hypothetical protein